MLLDLHERMQARRAFAFDVSGLWKFYNFHILNVIIVSVPRTECVRKLSLRLKELLRKLYIYRLDLRTSVGDI